MLFAGRISGLEEEARQQRQVLSKVETEKRQLQEKLTDLEKVNYVIRLKIRTDLKLLWTIFYFHRVANLNFWPWNTFPVSLVLPDVWLSFIGCI